MPDDFKIQFDADIFEKANAAPGKKRRIGGIASIQTKDRQAETLIQKGLDFSEFVDYGWFNDNHSKATEDVLGYPDTPAKYFKKGQTLPNGKPAKAPGHWVEGYLLNTNKANSIWDLAKNLQSTPRRLGFSVEGKIQKRDSLDKSVVAKAIVREVAITKSPVNTDAQMDVLVKSLTVGTPTPGEAVTGPKTGEDAGQVLAKESLEKKKKKVRKSLTYGQAFDYIQSRYPGATPQIVNRLIEVTQTLKHAGKL